MNFYKRKKMEFVLIGKEFEYLGTPNFFYGTKKENLVIPPNHNITGAFTDMLKAVEYIKLVSKDEIKIKDIPNWKMITLLKHLDMN